jgi:hypothetical protein
VPRLRASLVAPTIFSLSLIFLAAGCSPTPPNGDAETPETPASSSPATLPSSPPAPETATVVSEDLVAPPDSLRLGDVIYEYLERAAVTERGPLLGEVGRRVPDNIEKTGYEWLESGDSNHLKRGTPVHAAKGYDPSFRVVARGDEGWDFYEVAANRTAERTAALLDIRGKTNLVGVRDESGAAVEVAYPFRGPTETKAFVDAVLDAPPVRASADYSHVGSLVFKLEDGTEAECSYEPGSGELYLGEEAPFLGVVLSEKLQGDLRRVL